MNVTQGKTLRERERGESKKERERDVSFVKSLLQNNYKWFTCFYLRLRTRVRKLDMRLAVTKCMIYKLLSYYV